MNYDASELAKISNEAREGAAAAADYYFEEILGGEDQYPCGFAWVDAYTTAKGNTRVGKAEIAMLKALGFKKSSVGKGYTWYNPSQHNCQNMDVKNAGAQAAAAVLKKYGFKAYATSRMD